MISWQNIFLKRYLQDNLSRLWVSGIIIATKNSQQATTQPVSLIYKFSRKSIARRWQTEYAKLQLFGFTKQLGVKQKPEAKRILPLYYRPKSSSGCLCSPQAKSFGGAYGGYSFIQHKMSIKNQ